MICLLSHSVNGELIAKIKAISRRLNFDESKKIKVKDIEIDLSEQRAMKSAKPLELTYIEFKLLVLLTSRRITVVSRKEILDRVWGTSVCVNERTVDVHIKRLRNKLGYDHYFCPYIETIYGIGYRFT